MARNIGASMVNALAAEAVIAAAAFLLPTILMGALFSHLSTSARISGISFGRAIGVNTLGAAAADCQIVDDLALFGGFIAGPNSLARFAERAPLNADDRPIVT